tara:strand:+ start:501 stop:1577 length:1077 start_codon:yes stop_codon:yes gene_type:complete
MPTVRIVDKFGEVVETKELEQFQIDVYRQAGYQITTLEDTAIVIPSDIQQILTGIENGDYTVPQWFIDVEVVNIKNGNTTPDRFRRQWTQGVNSGVIKSTIGTQVQSYTYSTPYGQFDTQATSEQEAFQKQQEFVQQKQQEEFQAQQTEIARQQEELLRQQQEQAQQEQQQADIEIPSIIPSIPMAEAVEQEQQQLNEKFTKNDVILCGKNFDIESGKIKGQVILEKSNTWNPYYNDIPLSLIVQYKDVNTNVTMDLVPYVVTFSQGMQPQLVNIERSTAFDISNYARVRIEIFLWKSLDNPIPFSEPLSFVLDADKEPIDICNPKAKIQRDDWLAKGVGIFGGLLGISLLISGNRKV